MDCRRAAVWPVPAPIPTRRVFTMRPFAVIGCGIMMMALVVGCGGGSEEDKIYSEMEKISNDMVKVMEKAKSSKDPAAAMAVFGELAPFMTKMQEIEKRVKALPKERQDALEKRVKEAPWMKKLESMKG